MRCKTLWRGGLLTTALLLPAGANAQVTITSDAGLFNIYSFRGVTLTNQVVVQPDLYLTVPGGGGAVVLGAWGNVEGGQYDNPNNDISEGGGTASFDATEIDVWGEYGHPLSKNVTGTLGGLLYLYPNKAGFTNQVNRTFEVYGKLQLAGVPLAPRLAAWYDVDKVKGAYLEGSIAQPVKGIPGFPLTLGALAGFSAGQGINENDPTEVANFAGDGLTHVDLSATGALSAGPVTISPTVHFLLLNDDFTKVTKPGTTKDAKAWAGVSLTWSKALTEVPLTEE
jgi:Bacterial protein of unknown function (Gcw_chp)